MCSIRFSPTTAGSIGAESRNLITTLRGVFASMGKSDQAVLPHFFLAALHSAFPQFATMASGGAQGAAGLDPALAAAVGMPTLQQQDANECWTEIIRMLQKATVDVNLMKSLPVCGGLA